MPDHPATLFTPPHQDPVQAHLDTLLLTRQHPWQFMLWNRTIHAVPAPFAPGFSPLAHTCLLWGEQKWYVEFGSLDFLSWHPALADLHDITLLPEDVQLAILDLACQPVQAALGHFMDAKGEFSDTALGAAPVLPAVATLALSLRSTGAHEKDSPIPVRIHVPNGQSSRILADRLAALPLRMNHAACQDLSVTICIDAGSMLLSIAELADLHQGDILLPPDYVAAQGTVLLRPCPCQAGSAGMSATTQTIHCIVQDNQATVMTSILTPKESAMTPAEYPSAQDQKTTPEAQADQTKPEAQTINTGAIEVELCFELERRVMTIADMAALAPGCTFTLGCDPLAPVALRVNGTLIGTGRLVDISGILGVQVTSLIQPGGQDAQL